MQEESFFEIFAKSTGVLFAENLKGSVLLTVIINPEGLKRKSVEIAECASAMNDNMNRIHNLVLGLGLEWQGSAEKAYTAKLFFVRQQFDFLYDSFMDLSKTLDLIAGEYEEIERQLMSQLEV